jgi:hypothetical protein
MASRTVAAVQLAVHVAIIFLIVASLLDDVAWPVIVVGVVHYMSGWISSFVDSNAVNIFAFQQCGTIRGMFIASADIGMAVGAVLAASSPKEHATPASFISLFSVFLWISANPAFSDGPYVNPV